MGGFFSLDGPFYKWGSILADIIILTLLWIICSIPVITMGASTAALFYVTTKRVSDNEGYVFKDFFKSFRANFKQATIVWLIYVVIILLILFNMFNIQIMGDLALIFLILQIAVSIELLIMLIYIFPMMSRFQMSVKELFKSSFVMANRHLLTTITCALCAFASVFLVFQFPPLIVLGMGLYAYVASYFQMKVYKKYRPEIDNRYQVDDLAESRKTMRHLDRQIAANAQNEVSTEHESVVDEDTI